MMYLSYEDMEIIGQSVLHDYAKSISIPVDINSFAQNYLGLKVLYRKLSDNGRILGLTTYKGAVIALPVAGGSVLCSVPEDTILLDERLLHDCNHRRERFTLAHECAHHILARMEAKEAGRNLNRDTTPGQVLSCRKLKTTNDWMEWQANSLASILLVPKYELAELIIHRLAPLAVTIYKININSLVRSSVKWLADLFDVSIKAMAIRLNGMGFAIAPA